MNIQLINLVGVVSHNSSNKDCQCGLPIMIKSSNINYFNKIYMLENNTSIHATCYDALSEDEKKLSPIKASHDDSDSATLVYYK